MRAVAWAMQQSRAADAREGWALTPDVILFGAAAVMTVAVIAFGIWLFVRAAREDTRGAHHEDGA